MQTLRHGCISLKALPPPLPPLLPPPSLPYSTAIPPTKSFLALPPEHQISAVLHKYDQWGPHVEHALAKLRLKLHSRCVGRVIHSSSDSTLTVPFFFWAAKQKGFRHDARTYCTLLRVLGKTKKFEIMSRLIDDMRNQGLEVPHEIYHVLIRSYADAGKVKSALDVFKQMKEKKCSPPIGIYDTLLHSLILGKWFGIAQEILREMVRAGLCQNKTCCNILFNLCKAKRVGDAKQVLQLLEEEGFLPSSTHYNMVMTALCRANKTDDVYRLFNHMAEKGSALDEYNYTTVLNSFIRSGKFHQGFLRTGNFDAALNLFHELGGKGCPPDVVSYDIMITAFFQQGKVDEALTIFQHMVNTEDTEQRSVPDTITYIMLLNGLLKNDRVEEGLSILKRWDETGAIVDAEFHNSVIRNLCKFGKVDEAIKVFSEALEKESPFSQCIYRKLYEGLCKKVKSG